MNLAKRMLYRIFVRGIKAYQRLFLDLQVWGRENIPKGPKIYVMNHITSTDPYWVLPVLREPVHLVNGPAYKSRICAKVLDAFEQINAMPAHREDVVAKAVEYLRRGEPVWIAPEGDIQEPFRLGRFYPGVGSMYRIARVPIVPIALATTKRAMREFPFSMNVEGRAYRTVTVLRGPFLISVGEPMMPDLPPGTDREQDEQVTKLVRDSIEQLLQDIRVDKFWL